MDSPLRASKVDIRILGCAADGRIVGRQSPGPVRAHLLVIDHGALVFGAQSACAAMDRGATWNTVGVKGTEGGLVLCNLNPAHIELARAYKIKNSG